MDLKKILGNIGCNALGTIFPPFGSMAVSVIKEALDLDDSATEAEVLKATTNATPEQVLKLKKAEYNFKLKLEEMGADILELEKEDRENARAFAKDTGTGSINSLAIFNAIFVLIVTFGTFMLAYNGKISHMEALEASILTLLIREAFGRYEQVCNFFFGSSHGSRSKDKNAGN